MAGGEGPGGNRVARWLWPRQNNSNPAFNHPHIQIHVRCINKTTFKLALKAHLLEDLVEN